MCDCILCIGCGICVTHHYIIVTYCMYTHYIHYIHCNTLYTIYAYTHIYYTYPHNYPPYIHLYRLQEAIIEYTNAIHLEPTHFKALSNRAYCYERLLQYKQALCDYSVCTYSM